MSFVKSIFTPAGTNARQNENDRQSNSENQLAGLLPGETQYQQSLQKFRAAQLPNAEQAVQNAYFNTTQGGRNAEAEAYAQQQNAASDQGAARAISRYAGNPSLATSAQLDAANQANQNTAGYAATLNSPAGENNAWMNYLASNSALSPTYSGADSIVGAINSQPTIQVGQGLGSFLGSALGSWATQGFPSIGSSVDSIVNPATTSAAP